MALAQFGANFVSSFLRAKQDKKLNEQSEAEKKATLKLIEIQMERAQQEQAARKQQQAAQQSVFDKMSAQITLPGTGVKIGNAEQAKPLSLTELLADPESAMQLLQSGMIDGKSLLASQAPAEPPEIALLRALQANPDLAELDRGRRAAGASSTNVNLGQQGLTPPPTGFFRPNPTKPGLQLEPGGPADIERAKAEQQRQSAADETTKKIGTVTETIETALGQVSKFTTGFAGARLAKIEGSPAYNLSKTLETIKANIGFDTLQAMRAASPTGGALGQVAVQELEALRSTIASLDQGQSDAQLKKNLEKAKGHYDAWEAAVDAAANMPAQLPDGIPEGSTQIGTSGGKPVYQAPDGKQYVVE